MHFLGFRFAVFLDLVWVGRCRFLACGGCLVVVFAGCGILYLWLEF